MCEVGKVFEALTASEYVLLYRDNLGKRSLKRINLKIQLCRKYESYLFLLPPRLVHHYLKRGCSKKKKQKRAPRVV